MCLTREAVSYFQSRRLSKIFGTYAGLFLKVLAKRTLCGEVEMKRYFLNAQPGVHQQSFGFENHIIIDPFECGASAAQFYLAAKVIGRETHPVGIKLNTALAIVILR